MLFPYLIIYNIIYYVHCNSDEAAVRTLRGNSDDI
jgi:hypothetical protein